jgi:hypothetical protein
MPRFKKLLYHHLWTPNDKFLEDPVHVLLSRNLELGGTSVAECRISATLCSHHRLGMQLDFRCLLPMPHLAFLFALPNCQRSMS